MTGSSPPMRGTSDRFIWISPISGIIPAHAGHISPFGQHGQFFRDHPRPCGAHLPLRKCHSVSEGSSPPMRGTLDEINEKNETGGIIPAHAGHIRMLGSVGTCIRDHPRPCGAHLQFQKRLDFYWGSSPPMRGTFWQIVHHFVLSGIIPAHAGHI